MNIKQKNTTAILLASFLIIAIAFTGFASAGNDKAMTDDEKQLQELTANISPITASTMEKIKEEKHVLKVEGQIPEIKEGAEVDKWMKKLDHVRDKITKNKELNSYLLDGPVLGYGFHTDGYFLVRIDENQEITDDEMEEISKVINKHAKSLGIKDVPIVFTEDKPMQFAVYPDPATIFVYPYFNKYDPIIGGIGHSTIVPTANGELVGFATMGFTAIDNNNQKGFVVASHSLNFQSNASIYHPKITAADYLSNYSIHATNIDVAFVPYNDVDPKIHIGNGNIVDVEGYYSWAMSGMVLERSGISSGHESGEYLGAETAKDIDGHIIDVVEHMEGQCIQGDSGGPVYYVSHGRHKLMGTVTGFSSYNGTPSTMYIPCREIVSELNIEPLEV